MFLEGQQLYRHSFIPTLGWLVIQAYAITWLVIQAYAITWLVIQACAITWLVIQAYAITWLGIQAYAITYWFSDSDNSVQSDEVGVSELPHDGGLLEEPDCGLLVGPCSEHFDGHLHLPLLSAPYSLTHGAKLTRAQMTHHPGNEMDG